MHKRRTGYTVNRDRVNEGWGFEILKENNTLIDNIQLIHIPLGDHWLLCPNTIVSTTVC